MDILSALPFLYSCSGSATADDTSRSVSGLDMELAREAFATLKNQLSTRNQWSALVEKVMGFLFCFDAVIANSSSSFFQNLSRLLCFPAPCLINNDLQTTLWVTQRCFYSFQAFRRSTPSSVKIVFYGMGTVVNLSMFNQSLMISAGNAQSLFRCFTDALPKTHGFLYG